MRVIGLAMAHIPDVLLYTNDDNVKAGIVEGGNVVNVVPPQGDKAYHAIITYKMEPLRTKQGADAHIPSYPDLKVFSEVAVRSIYARGMEP